MVKGARTLQNAVTYPFYLLASLVMPQSYLPWGIRQLSDLISPVPAFIAVGLLALLPGHLVAFLAIGMVLDRQPPLVNVHPTTLDYIPALATHWAG